MIAAEMIVPGSSSQLLSIEECRPELQKLDRLWQKMRGDRSMPSRRDFDPTDARHLLRHIILIDVFPNTPAETRFRVRLQGTSQVDYGGMDWTGCYLHEKTDKVSADRLCAVGDYIVASRKPWMSTGNLYWNAKKPYRKFESILLPLSNDDVDVNMILGLTVFF